MRICVLSDGDTADFDPGPYLQGYDWEMFTLSAPVYDRIRDLVEGGGFDVFLNLCRGYELDRLRPEGPGYLGTEVIQALESLDAAFTGSDSRGFELTLDEQRAAAEANGLRFVNGHLVESVERAVERAAGLTYPIMVKHPRQRYGAGIPEEARADTLDEVKVEVARMLNNFGSAVVEEYVSGAEYHVLVVEDPEECGGPVAYPPVELVMLPAQESTRRDVTWASDLSLEFRKVEEASVAEELRRIGERMFRGLGLQGYALTQIRTGADGHPVVLGVRPDPAIMSPSRELGVADYVILLDEEGYPGFLRRIFAAALARRADKSGRGRAPVRNA